MIQDNADFACKSLSQSNQLAKELYNNFLHKGYKHTGVKISYKEPYDSEAFTMYYDEGTTIFIVHVANLSRILKEDLRPWHDRTIDWVNPMGAHYTHVLNAFILVGKDTLNNHFPLLAKDAEVFTGQSPYNVYWHIDVATEDIHSPQLGDIMGLSPIIEQALKNCHSTKKVNFPDIVESPPKSTYEKKVYSVDIDREASMETNEVGYIYRLLGWKELPHMVCLLFTIHLFITIAMYTSGITVPDYFSFAIRFNSIVPSLIWNDGEFYRLFTSIFVHYSVFYMILNMFFLVFFGANVEYHYGRGRFLLIYFSSGLAGALITFILTTSDYAIVGAAGATAGILGAGLAYTRHTGSNLGKSSKNAIMACAIFGIILALINSGISVWANVGGFIVGSLVGWMQLDKNPTRYGYSQVGKLDMKLALVVLSVTLFLGAIRFNPERYAIVAEGSTISVSDTAITQSPQLSTEILSPLSPSDMFERYADAVFSIYTSVDGNRFRFTGSGFFICPSGIAVTNHHVMRNRPFAYIRTHNGQEFDILGYYFYDIDNDLAVIQVSGERYQFAYLIKGNSGSLRIGDSVFAIGSPLGHQNTFSDGMVSRLDHTGHFGIYRVYGMIQITAPISPGSSGGALLNRYGQVVGITTATSARDSAQAVNFAVPIARVDISDIIRGQYFELPIDGETISDEVLLGHWDWHAGFYIFYDDGTGNRMWSNVAMTFEWQLDNSTLRLELSDDTNEQWDVVVVSEDELLIGGATFTRVFG